MGFILIIRYLKRFFIDSPHPPFSKKKGSEKTLPLIETFLVFYNWKVALRFTLLPITGIFGNALYCWLNKFVEERSSFTPLESL